jgi:hypothetical protein
VLRGLRRCPFARSCGSIDRRRSLSFPEVRPSACLLPMSVWVLKYGSSPPVACLQRRFFRKCCCYWGRTRSDLFSPESADAPAGTNAYCPVDGLHRIFVTRVQLRVLCPGSRAVRVLFSCSESRSVIFALFLRTK